jgi:hypothetical protein
VEGGIGTKVALAGFIIPIKILIGYHHGSAGRIGAGFHAFSASDAYTTINNTYVSKPGIGFERIRGTGFDAERVNALPALLYGYIVRISFKRILNDLYSRQRLTLYPLMNQGTRQHTARASLAFGDVDQQISVGCRNTRTTRYRSFKIFGFPVNRSITAASHHQYDGAGILQKISA